MFRFRGKHIVAMLDTKHLESLVIFIIYSYCFYGNRPHVRISSSIAWYLYKMVTQKMLLTYLNRSFYIIFQYNQMPSTSRNVEIYSVCAHREMSNHLFFIALSTSYPALDHGTYIRWYLRNRCARREQSLLFHLFQAFD